MELTSKQRAYLRGEAQTIDPIVMIGKDGLTENVTAALDEALTHHELVKVKFQQYKEDVKEIAAAGEYRRIPVCRELYSDRYTPVEVMRTLRKASRHCYLLESASQTEVWGRYSFLGYDPTMEITCTDGVVRIRKTGNEGPDEVEEQKVSHPGNVLRRIISDYNSPVMESMPPFTGGLVGYFSYDYIKYSEPKLKLEDEEMQDFRDMDMMLFDRVIAFDHYRQKVLLIAGVMADRVEESYRQAEEALEEMAALIRGGEKKEFAK